MKLLEIYKEYQSLKTTDEKISFLEMLSYCNLQFNINFDNLIRDLEKNILELSDKLFKDYLKRDYIFFLQMNTAQLMTNVKSEIPSFVEYINKMMIFFGEIIILLGITILLFHIDFFGTLIILFFLGVFIFLINVFTKKKIDIYGKERIIVDSELNKQLMQGIATAKDVKILDREADLIHQVDKNLFKMTRTQQIMNFITGLPRFSFEMLMVCAFTVLVLVMVGIKKDMLDIIQYLGVFAVASFRIVPSAARMLTSFQAIKHMEPGVKILLQAFDSKNNL